MTDTITHETELPVDIPGLGPATIRAGVDFYNVHLEGVAVFGKRYREDVTVLRDGRVDIGRYAGFTTAARRAVIKAVSAWAPTWIDSRDAVALLVATVKHHNRIGEDTLRREIERATNHLRELEMLAEKFRAADPDEYVSPWETTYQLTENGR
jgi:hypothetical protein